MKRIIFFIITSIPILIAACFVNDLSRLGTEDDIVYDVEQSMPLATESEISTSNSIVPGQAIGPATIKFNKEDVLKILGQPDIIYYGSTIYTLDNLPPQCFFVYTSQGISFFIDNQDIRQITTYSPNYESDDNISVGSPIEQVIEVYGTDFRRDKLAEREWLIYDDRGISFAFTPEQNTVDNISIYTPAADGYGVAANLNQGVASLQLGESDLDYIISMLGETDYLGSDCQALTKADLKDDFILRYANNISIQVKNNLLAEINIKNPGYVFAGGLRIGSSVSQATAVLGQAQSTVSDASPPFKDGILYTDIQGEQGSAFYMRRDKGISLVFKDNKVTEITLIPSQPQVAEVEIPVVQEEPVTIEPTEKEEQAEQEVEPSPVLSKDDLQRLDLDQEFRSGFYLRIAQLDINKSTIEDIINIFGQPICYAWEGELFNEDNLPRQYLMRYPDNFSICIVDQKIEELKFENSGYTSPQGLEVGLSLEKTLQIIGQPDNTIKGEKDKKQDGVLYLDIDGITGAGYYESSSLGIKVYFKNNKISAFYIKNPTK